jgi:hypothetical protein
LAGENSLVNLIHVILAEVGKAQTESSC